MLEVVRGYAAALLEEGEASGSLARLSSELRAVSALVVSSEPLRLALTDPSVAASDREAVVRDLLSGRVLEQVGAQAVFAVLNERAPELPKTLSQLLELAESEERRAAENKPLEPEPAVGRSGALERVRGYAERVFERVDSQRTVDEIEDELFRFARILEQSSPLAAALTAFDTPLPLRLAVLDDLLAEQVRRETLLLCRYVVRAGRSRAIVGALDYLVDLAAAERGRRLAEVSSAVELDADERRRLSEALSGRVRRNVELRVTVDPSLIGGLRVSVGDTVIDGTVRQRLERLREALVKPE
jgi:F-type H+-transporting ATPase subunit delta